MNQQNDNMQNTPEEASVKKQNSLAEQNQSTVPPQAETQTVVEPQPSVETPKAAPVAAPVKKKKSKKILIAVIAILLVTCVGVGAYFGINALNNDSDPESPKKTNKVTETEAPDITAENVTVVELYPDREVSKSDLKEYAELIEKRAAILGEAYTVSVDSDKIVLTVDKALLGETAMERSHTMELLISRGNVNFGTNEYTAYNSVAKNEISEIKITELNVTDTLAEYKVDISESRYDQLSKIKSDSIYALEVTLESSAGNKLEGLIEDSYSSPKLTVVHDYNEDSSSEFHFFGSVLLKEKDNSSVLYIVNPGASYEKTAQLMKKILEQDEADFGLVMQIKDEPTWETEDKYLGKNQVTEMDEKAIVAEFHPNSFTRSYNSEVDFAEQKNIIKERMDVLGIDYMFGTAGFDDKTYCVKVYPDDFAPDFLRLIFNEKDVSVRSSFDYLSCFSDLEIVDTNEKLGVRMSSYESPEDIAADYNIPDNMVYLVVNDVTVAYADITQLYQEENYYYLDFVNFLCFNEQTATEEEKNILNLLVHIYGNQYTSFEGSFRFRTYNENGESSYTNSVGDLDWKYPAYTAVDTQVFETIRSMGHEVEKLVDKRNMLVITLDIPVDENLAENFTNEVKQVYAACNFDDGSYNEFNFVLKDETKESPANSFRIEGYKDMSDGKIILNDFIGGPKFSDYWMEVFDITESDTFFTERSF